MGLTCVSLGGLILLATTQVQDVQETREDILTILRNIEHRHENLVTEFKLEVFIGPGDAILPAGEVVEPFIENTEYHARALIDQGRVRIDRWRANGIGKETHWWTGDRAVADAGDSVLAFSGHIRERLLNCASLFNESAGAALLSPHGLAADLAQARFIGLDRNGDLLTCSFGLQKSDTTRFRLVLDVEDSPRIQRWESLHLNEETGEWDFNVGYRVIQWREYEGLLLPAVAFRESSRVNRETGAVERIVHRYTRTGVSIIEDDEVARRMRLPLDEDTTMYDTLAAVEWRIADRRLVLDHVHYRAAKPIWLDPVPLLEGLLKTAQGTGTYAGPRKLLAYRHVVELLPEGSSSLTLAVVDSDPAAVPDEPQIELPEGVTATFGGWKRVTPGDESSRHVRWQGELAFEGAFKGPVYWVDISVDGVEQPMRIQIRQ